MKYNIDKLEKISARPNILEFMDYRAFVKEFVAYLRTQKEFSFRKWAKKAGISSASILYLIIQAKTGISDKIVSKLARGFDLTRDEAELFHLLVKYGQAKGDSGKQFFLREIEKFKQTPKVLNLSPQSRGYYKKWYYPVIREMVGLPQFRNSADWISSQLKGRVSVKEINAALIDLLDLNLLKKNGDSFLQTDISMRGDNEDDVSTMANFHREMIEQSLLVQKGVANDQRDLSSLTLSGNRQVLQLIKEDLLRFRREILTKYGEARASHDNIVQLNIQLFLLM